MADGVPFDEWKARAAERVNRKAARERARERAAAEAKEAAQQAANVAFSRWNVDKSVHDAALELMPAVGLHRAQDEATWREVGVVLANVHLAVEARHKALGAVVDANPKRSAEHTFLTWSRKNHAFDSVRGPPARPPARSPARPPARPSFRPAQARAAATSATTAIGTSLSPRSRCHPRLPQPRLSAHARHDAPFAR
jgi:hypothetical protein